jgi:hypothetical protein
MPTDDQDQARGGSGIPTGTPKGIDAATARAWLDEQLARQGITARTITNRATLRKLATLFYAGLDELIPSSSRSSGLPKDRTRGQTGGQRRSGQ